MFLEPVRLLERALRFALRAGRLCQEPPRFRSLGMSGHGELDKLSALSIVDRVERSKLCAQRVLPAVPAPRG